MEKRLIGAVLVVIVVAAFILLQGRGQEKAEEPRKKNFTIVVGPSGVEEVGSGKAEAEIPVPPQLIPPSRVVLPNLTTICVNDTAIINEDVERVRFVNCTVRISRDGIRVAKSEFVGSQLLIQNHSNLVFADNVFRNFEEHEQPAVVVENSENATFEHSEFLSNFMAMDIHSSPGIVVKKSLFSRNYGHNALAVDGGSRVLVDNSFFDYNYPHAILVLNRDADPDAWVGVIESVFDHNVEDAINFEDFRGARDQSVVASNHIVYTAWSGLNIEYNSWDANILVDGNFISGSGESHTTFPSLPSKDEWHDGWEHGIRLEDSGGIIIRGNIIVNNQGNGVDVRNSRDIILENNYITENEYGLALWNYDEASLTRGTSPLGRDDAGSSELAIKGGQIFGNREDIFVEEGSILTR
jgi:parallel beta-helix repeat protein